MFDDSSNRKLGLITHEFPHEHHLVCFFDIKKKIEILHYNLNICEYVVHYIHQMQKEDNG